MTETNQFLPILFEPWQTSAYLVTVIPLGFGQRSFEKFLLTASKSH